MNLSSFQHFAQEKLGKKAVVLPNNSQTDLLCISNSPKQLYPAFPQQACFFVYDVEKELIVYKESLENGSGGWFSDSELIIKAIPGIIEEDGITIMTHTYNLLTRRQCVCRQNSCFYGPRLELYSGSQFPGAASGAISWDGKTNDGITAASGIYLYRMEADGFVQQRKMMFIK